MNRSIVLSSLFFTLSLLISTNVVLSEVVNTGGERIDLKAHRVEGVWTAVSANITNNTVYSVPASVPGGIYSDLDAAGTFSTAIYYRYNDLETRWVGRTNWTFSRNFQVSSTFLEKERAVLVCDGLDTVANVYVNDVLVGSSENMFVRYIYDVKSALKVGENKIVVEFQSPVEYARREYEEQAKNYPVLPDKLVPEFQGENHANHIRKMQASFSWDWGPSYPSSGIWKNIYFQAYDTAVIRDTLIFMNSNKKQPDETSTTTWTVTSRNYVDLANNSTESPLQFNFEINEGEKNIKNITKNIQRLSSSNFEDVQLEIKGDEVKMWWPNGYGAQPLYNAKVTLLSAGKEISSQSFRIGFRTVELSEAQLSESTASLGNEFEVKVNGRPIYSKGSNSIPLHVLPERVTKEQTEWLFESAKDAHMNMIRVWGGGIYESDLFFDLADETGVMIWEDFMFACSMYPATERFLNNVKKEVDTQVKRLQYHAGLAIWATNNENEAALRNNWYGTQQNYSVYAADYVKLYIDTIKTMVEELDPSRQCLPSSPTNGRQSGTEGWIADYPYSNIYGDVHFYNYQSDPWDYRTFPNTRYASEYGYQSWPSPETFELSTSRDTDWFWDSVQMNHRQHHPGGQAEIPGLIKHNLPLPENYNEEGQFLNLLELNRISQAVAYKTQTEHYRRLSGSVDNSSGEGRNMGALYWQLNDIWPGASWASVEYNGRWKLVHYYARHFFHPTLLSLYKTYDTSRTETGVAVSLVSDSPQPYNGFARVRIFRLDQNEPLLDTITQATFTDTTPGARDILQLNNSDLGDCANNNSSNVVCLVYTTMENTPDNFLFLQYPKVASAIQNPQLRVANWTAVNDKEIRITLETSRIALFVTLNINNVNIKGQFSDNGFLIVNRMKEITFTSQSPLSLSEFQSSFELWSLYDLVSIDDAATQFTQNRSHPYWKNVIPSLKMN